MPDLTNLPLIDVVGFALLLAAIDTIVAIIIALINKTFDGNYVTNFLVSHILKIVTPIIGLAVLGHGFPAAGIPAVPAAALAATAALGAYLVAVIASVTNSFADKAIPPAA